MLFAIHAILRLSFFAAHQSRAQWFRDYSAGLNPDLAALDQAEGLLADWTPLSIALLPGAILLAVWSRRATKNLRSWGETTTWGPGWAAWGWFVPIMWFFVPYLVVRAAFRHSPQDLSRKWNRKSLSIMWAVCFFGFWIAMAAPRLAEQWRPSPYLSDWTVAGIESAVRSDALSAAGELLFCVVSVLTFVVIRAISNMHDPRNRDRSWHGAILQRPPRLLRLAKLIGLAYLGLILVVLLVWSIITGFSGLGDRAPSATATTTVTEAATGGPTSANPDAPQDNSWSVSDCVAIPPHVDTVRKVQCSSTIAGGDVVAVVADIDHCPLVADLGLEIDTGRFACIDDWSYEVADAWQVGACVTFEGDLVEPVDCASDRVNGHVIANTSDPDQCPAPTESYVDYDDDRVACLSNTVVTTAPAATRDVPEQYEFNEADEREYVRSLDRVAKARLRYRMLALVGEDVIDDWTHEEFMEALTARQAGTREMALQFKLDEQLIQESFKAARLSIQAGDTSGSFAPSQLGKVSGADAQAVSSLIESLEARSEVAQLNGPQINLIDPAYLRSVLDQQFQLRVGRRASSREQQSFVNEIHAAQRAGLTGPSLDPVARAGEFAEQADPFGAEAIERLNAGRTIREALQGTGP
ncbi:DUF4328 domain-containing protein [Candidatus Poriferisodalis sp.]|uniref:DUF4328 domain-containing protein n=1 Tax=Candidatus Poriferisodalis sp. TaxID=3101277 RepID=UPI003B01E803